MGFDFNIHMELYMCGHSGKPYYYSRDSFEKIYTIPIIIVPEPHRRFCSGRGHLFGLYIQPFTNTYSCSVNTFLDHFPLWEEIVNDTGFHQWADWTEDDHNAFRAAIVWFTKQDVEFTINWSY